ncbi:efflux RND transporter periplasmic adaptor subunit [Pontibacter mangrovi]|uniref:Efflux RND transporter periplasmic adaptor subunit n=1 Tax=Pontibacter mangrovi TaxID=2589816 RepID=A0A501VZ54_9BACT|nr:efflux RND transporter periplasmic adaptor subunit [Pontibacter mangrovi]TPE43023.1 efflux RND transporter periplasmic adaptor subunit [Pontibacter mangrovi]
MKKVIYIIAVLVALGAIGFTLMNNKKEMAATAAIAERKSEAIPVVLTAPKMGAVDKSFTAQGTFVPEQDLTLLSETQGQVTKLYKDNGDRVRAGEALAQVDAQLLRAELVRAQANYTKSKRDLERFENLAAGDAITKRQLEEARLGFSNAEANLITAKKRLADATIKAPISGKINEKFIEVGSFLNPGTKLFNIVNVDNLKMNVKVSEGQVLLIREGEKVKVAADAGNGEAFEGTVKAIAAKGDNSLNYNVELQISNTAGNPLKAGMYGTAFFEVADQGEALLLEREALVGSIQHPQVYVVKNGSAFLKDIKVGSTHGKKVEVTGGLEEGEQVVQSGQINLKNGTKVTVLK